MNHPAIEIKNLTKIYQKSKKSSAKEALKGVDLQVKKGSIFGLLGPNGAGKSTIINILAGLVNKTSGTVKIAGFDLDTETNQTKFKIGIVPQELVIDPFFNVYETLEIYAGYYGIRKQDRKTEEIIEALGLKDKIKAAPRSLSGGMKRRLLVAKALVHNPEVLVLDEPTAGVDVELRTQLWNYVRKLNDAGTTIVLTTHYLEEAEELCDEIAIINHGKVIACEKKNDLMRMMPENKELIVTLAGDIEKAPNLTDKDLTITLKDKNQLNINYQPSKINIIEILSLLEKNQLKIADISTKQADLESVFKYLTRKSDGQK
ncbi:MAG: putative Phosphonate transporter, ATPase component [Rickettsiaceae bacterium]|jgi:ABC-2 type transport system ATP-binding protein|nr:putative Phosphonate transporter, ATPase component [Rickettsiaceae bacterium]